MVRLRALNEGPIICPLCGEKALVPVHYGCPSEELIEDVELGRAVLGGCAKLQYFDSKEVEIACTSCNFEALLISKPKPKEKPIPLIINSGNLKKLVVGFDAAWSEKNKGHLIGLAREAESWKLLGSESASLGQAFQTVLKWHREFGQGLEVEFLIDMPTIVENETGLRPVEQILSSPISRFGGGVQPSSKSKPYFDDDAPIWGFLENLKQQIPMVKIIETYPAASLMALNWWSPHTSRALKYNPKNSKQFSLEDWRYLCQKTSDLLLSHGIKELADDIYEIKLKPKPNKTDQDLLDAVLCLLPVLSMNGAMTIGNVQTGLITIAHGERFEQLLLDRIGVLGWQAKDWITK